MLSLFWKFNWTEKKVKQVCNKYQLLPIIKLLKLLLELHWTPQGKVSSTKNYYVAKTV